MKQIRFSHKKLVINFQRWSRKAFAAFASLKAVVRIGVLSVQILKVASLKNLGGKNIETDFLRSIELRKKQLSLLFYSAFISLKNNLFSSFENKEKSKLSLEYLVPILPLYLFSFPHFLIEVFNHFSKYKLYRVSPYFQVKIQNIDLIVLKAKDYFTTKNLHKFFFSKQVLLPKNNLFTPKMLAVCNRISSIFYGKTLEFSLYNQENVYL